MVLPTQAGSRARALTHPVTRTLIHAPSHDYGDDMSPSRRENAFEDVVGSQSDGRHVGCDEVETVFGSVSQHRRPGQRGADMGSGKDQTASSRRGSSRGPVGALPEEEITWGDTTAASQGLEPAL